MKAQTVLVAIVLLAGGYAFWFNMNDNAGSGGTLAASTSTAVATPVASLTAADLGASYGKNGVAADNQYKGKVISVNGTVTTVNNDILDKPYVMLAGADGSEAIQCSFDESSKGAVGALSKGQTVTIVGTCDGQLGYVELSKCRLE